MISTIGLIPAMAAPIPAPTNADSDRGGVPDPLRPEFLQQAQADGEAAAVAADVLAHQEDPVVPLHGLPGGGPHRVAVGGLDLVAGAHDDSGL